MQGAPGTPDVAERNNDYQFLLNGSENMSELNQDMILKLATHRSVPDHFRTGTPVKNYIRSNLTARSEQKFRRNNATSFNLSETEMDRISDQQSILKRF